MTWSYGFGGGMGLFGLISILLIAAFWILVIVGLVLGVRWLLRAERSSRLPGPPPAPGGAPGSRPDDPLEILRQRYARGEIDDEEYERRRKTLGGA